MKKFLIAAIVMIAGFGIAAAQAPATVEDQLKLKETDHDFGKIPQGKPVTYTFQITNTGTAPLTLEDVHASCGCTTPEWSRDAIPAGATTVIKVGYNAASEGDFTKDITIKYNGVSKVLHIKGTVWKAPEGSAPANASVQFLKKQTL